MADLLSKDMLADLIINIINIVILFLVTKKLLYKPVKSYLDKRKQAGADALAEAEKLRAEAQLDAEKYSALVADAESVKEEAVRQAEREASLRAGSIIADAEKQAEAIKTETREKAEKEKEKMLADAKEQLGAIAVDISEKIIGREITDNDNRK
ncbi:MAG: ATP synthase F0 subunit B, partial [Clostridia bacterium]|nr:ATP synthase F0 subunit B [Clostridia bacterium]